MNIKLNQTRDNLYHTWIRQIKTEVYQKNSIRVLGVEELFSLIPEVKERCHHEMYESYFLEYFNVFEYCGIWIVTHAEYESFDPDQNLREELGGLSKKDILTKLITDFKKKWKTLRFFSDEETAIKFFENYSKTKYERIHEFTKETQFQYSEKDFPHL